MTIHSQPNKKERKLMELFAKMNTNDCMKVISCESKLFPSLVQLTYTGALNRPLRLKQQFHN
jgi:hypothetical protein